MQPRSMAETSKPLLPNFVCSCFLVDLSCWTSAQAGLQAVLRGLMHHDAMRIAPMLRWNSLSLAERSSERVRVLVPEQVRSFGKFEDRVAEVVPSHLVSRVL